MRILGYDPGTVNQGFALLEFDSSNKTVTLEREWTLELKKSTMQKRMRTTHDFVKNIVTAWEDLYHFSSERIVVTGNTRDAQNRMMGVIMLAAEDMDFKFYPPAVVKKLVSGYHKASKNAIAFAVLKMLNLEKDYVFSSNHASDAAAIALTYLINELGYPHGSTESNSK